MQQCTNCGESVTARFARVFGDNDDRLFACRNCAPLRELCEGRASEGGRPTTVRERR